MWSGSKQLRMAIESPTSWRESSACWMFKRAIKYSVGVRLRHPKTSFNTLSMSQEYSAVEQTIDRADVLNALDFSPHPDLASRLNRKILADVFFFFRIRFQIRTIRECSVQLDSKIDGDWKEGFYSLSSQSYWYYFFSSYIVSLLR